MLVASGVFVVLQVHLSLSLSLLMSRLYIMVCECQRPYEESEDTLRHISKFYETTCQSF